MNELDGKTVDILTLLIEQENPIATRYIADKLNISSRTVLRKIPSVEKHLKKYNLNLIKKPGFGMQIKGSAEQKDKLIKSLKSNSFKRKYSQDERQLYILIELLKSKEPIKIYKFKSELNVTEGTISVDLNNIEKLLREYNINLIRKQGLGVYIEGRESSLRKVMMRIIYQSGFAKEVLDNLGSLIKRKVTDEETITTNIKNQLLNEVDKETVEKIERIVYDTKIDYNYQLNENQYIALIVHIVLVIQRIKAGEAITINKDFLEKLKKKEEFKLAQEIVYKIKQAFNIEFPEDEVGYITMHLIGSRKYFSEENETEDDFFIEKYSIVKLSRKIIKFVQAAMNVNLMKDDKLLIDLSMHLETAIRRLSMNMDIRNPLLEQIKTNYSHVFNVTKDACKIIEEECGFRVLDTEIGYIALHIGAALERLKTYNYKVIVACSSGIGTSRLLSSKLEKEFSNLKVEDTVSVIDIERGNVDFSICDFIVSTIEYSFNDKPSITVNPLLLEEDKIKILKTMDKVKNINFNSKKYVKTSDFKVDLKKKINFGNAIINILNNIKYYDDICVKNLDELIDKITQLHMNNHDNYKELNNDIRKREELGHFILEETNTIFIHCRSNAVRDVNIGFIKLKEPFFMEESLIELVIMEFAPKEIDSEYIECISKINQEIFKDTLLKNMCKKEICDYINNILKDFYNSIEV
ncbi:BglG family transcription antiterminator [Clostridium niameyense]|uniref:BglG family transcription antiterminator n=1 Tax=Clostridium niameyense TaxID=1622073 RepID=UPI00067ED2C9|nr:PRD domain-containing protein [Clostridium niameyense]